MPNEIPVEALAAILIFLTPPFWRFSGFVIRNYFLADMTAAIGLHDKNDENILRELQKLKDEDMSIRRELRTIENKIDDHESDNHRHQNWRR